MKKVLIVSSVASMIEQFNMDNIKILQNLNCEVHVATNFNDPGTISNQKAMDLKKKLKSENVVVHQVNFSRNIFNLLSIIKSYFELKKISKMSKYEMVHCHSPIGGVITRLVFNRQPTKIMYTAHGFQFFENGPKKDWILFYPIEKVLSRFTDVLLTINRMDYKLAKNKFKQKLVYHIPGVGIKEPTMYSCEDKQKIRKKYNIPEKGILLISIGELSKRKNHKVIIQAMSLVENDNLYYLICGRGEELENLKKLILENKLEERVTLLGYVEDVQQLLFSSDLSLFPSKREGLGLAGLESLSVGTPLISSDVQGIPDYSKHGLTGYIAKRNEPEEYAELITSLVNDKQLRERMGLEGIEISKKYFQSNVNILMEDIYIKTLK